GLRDADRDALAHVFLKAGNSDCQFVLSRGQLRQRIVTGGRTLGPAHDAGFYVPNFNRRPGYYGSGRIRNRTGNGSPVALSEYPPREKTHNNCKAPLAHRQPPIGTKKLRSRTSE